MTQKQHRSAAIDANQEQGGAAGGAARLLSTAEAVKYLAGFGVQTSRRMIETLRDQGTLPALRVRGRVRILYAPADLVAAFIDTRAKPCRSNCSDAQKPAPITSAAPSQDRLFLKALDAARAARPMRSA